MLRGLKFIWKIFYLRFLTFNPYSIVCTLLDNSLLSWRENVLHECFIFITFYRRLRCFANICCFQTHPTNVTISRLTSGEKREVFVNTGFWLVDSDVLTWILASDWLRGEKWECFTQGQCLSSFYSHKCSLVSSVLMYEAEIMFAGPRHNSLSPKLSISPGVNILFRAIIREIASFPDGFSGLGFSLRFPRQIL